MRQRRCASSTNILRAARSTPSCAPPAGRTTRACRHERAADLARLEHAPEGEITPEYITACVRRHLDPNAIVLNEGISNYHTVINHLGLTRPGSMLTSGGGSLGWNGGAAIGVKLAAAGADGGRDDRRRVLHVLGPVHGALDGAPIPHAVSDDRLQ